MIRLCSSLLRIPRILAKVAEYAMSIDMACPCRSGTSGTSSWSGDHLHRVSGEFENG